MLDAGRLSSGGRSADFRHDAGDRHEVLDNRAESEDVRRATRAAPDERRGIRTNAIREVLRAALIRETAERRRAECLAKMQTEVVQLALDLLVREPDIEGFFGALTKTMVERARATRAPCG